MEEIFSLLWSFLNTLAADAAYDILKAFCGGILTAIVGILLVDRLTRRRFGGWVLEIIDASGEVATRRLVGINKMKAVLDDESELSVFIKGVASPYGWLNVDPLTKGREIGLLVVDKKGRKILVDLTKNPPKPPPTQKG